MDLVLLLDSFISSVFVSVILFSAGSEASMLRCFESGCNTEWKRSLTFFCEIKRHLFKKGVGLGECYREPD